MDQLFDIHLSMPVTIAMTVAFIAMLVVVTLYTHRVTKVSRHLAGRRDMPQPSSLPGVSVIVYERNNIAGLERVLESLFDQQYDGPYEIVVVSDGNTAETRDAVCRLAAGHDNVRFTYVPDDTCNVSRRKLAITLGVKAARKPYIILTRAEAVIPGPEWLYGMARNFADGHDIVIGHAVFDRTNDTAFGSSVRAFDRAADAATYLGAAIGAEPYRGTGYNMGFSRELFFDCRGFAGTLNFEDGDEDIFVAKMAARGNSAVELDERSRVLIDYYNPRNEHRYSRRSHRRTGARLRKGPRIFMALGSWMIWLWLIASVAAVSLAIPNLVPAAAMLVTGIILWVTVSLAWRRSLRALGESVCAWAAPLWLLGRPFRR